jgi:hypothetical protein
MRWSARKVDLRVDFAGGAPMVWFPKTVEPLGEWWGMGRGDGARGKEPISSVHGTPDHLSWQVLFPVADKLPEHKCPAYPWKGAALKPNADPFSVDLYLQDLQKFVFYEGMLPNRNAVRLRAERDGAGYVLSNAGNFTALDVYVIDRAGDVPKLAYVAELSKIEGLRAEAVPLKAAADWNERTAVHLRERLCRGGGLFGPEAEGLVDIWRQEFFGQPGLHLLYRLPPAEYDRMLPLQVAPKPEKVARVGLAWQPHLEADLPKRVEDLVEKLRDEDIDTRERATSDLRLMGVAAVPRLRRFLEEEKDAEALSRIKGLIEAVTTDPETHLKEWKRLLRSKE